jgi:hypothetical protein
LTPGCLRYSSKEQSTEGAFGTLFECRSKSRLEPKLSWLGNKSMSKLVQFFPSVLQVRIEDNLELKLSWLQALHSVLAYSIKDTTSSQTHMAQRYTWVGCQRHLLTSPYQSALVSIGALSPGCHRYSSKVQKEPSVLYLSVEANLEPKLSWLEDGLGLDKATRVGAS